MSSSIKVGQKLYHFAYGPLTVTGVSTKYVDTVADIPLGYRGGSGTGEPKQTWILETVGHWLFESPDEVGNENNNFDWKAIWPDYEHAPVLPVEDAKDKSNWHPFFGTSHVKASPVGISGGRGGASPVGVSGSKSGGPSPVGISK